MSKRIPDLDIGALRTRFDNREPLSSIAASVGIGTSTLLRHLIKAGYSPGDRIPSRETLDHLYTNQQMSISAIAKQFCVTDKTAWRWLVNAGVAIRPMSESQKIRMGRLSPAERSAAAVASHDVIRGRPRTEDELERRAKTREAKGLGISALDVWLAERLRELGPPTVHVGVAIGPYTVDLRMDHTVIEIFGGGWHGGGRAAARWPKRIRYLLDQGFHVIVVWADKRYPLDANAARAIMDFVQTDYQKWSSGTIWIRQYMVLRGSGERIVHRDARDADFPVKPSMAETIAKRSLPRPQRV